MHRLNDSKAEWFDLMTDDEIAGNKVSPSDMLSRGEVRDFISATYIYERAIEREIADSELDQFGREWLEREIVSTKIARTIYTECNEESDAFVVAALRINKLDIFADCLESGDYRNLAI
jgi:hypothetical protein